MRVFWGLTVIILIVETSAWSHGGGGSHVGGGANAIELPNDTGYILADPYILHPGRENKKDFENFDPMIKFELERIGHFLVRLGAAIDDSPDDMPPEKDAPPDERATQIHSQYLSLTGPSKFFVQTVKDPLLEYRMMDDFSTVTECGSENDVGKTPEGSKITIVGCTKGPVTWINKKVFSRMNVREQAKTLLHERLHDVGKEIPHEFIADFTKGMDTILSIYDLQLKKDPKINRPKLSPDQVKEIETVITRIAQTKLSAGRPLGQKFWDQWKVFARGGGLVHRDSQVSDKAYVGVGSIVGKGSILEAGSEIIDSSCFLVSCQLAQGASLFESIVSVSPSYKNPNSDFLGKAYRAHLGIDAKMLFSTFETNYHPGMNEDLLDLDFESRVENSIFSGLDKLRLDRAAAFTESVVNASRLNAGLAQIKLDTHSQIRNLVAPMIYNRTKDQKNDPRIEVPSSSIVDFDSKSVCESDLFLIVDKDISLDSTEKLKASCQKFPMP